MSLRDMVMGRMSMHEVRSYSTEAPEEMTLNAILKRAQELGIYAPPRPSETLGRVLAELDILVLDRDDVEKYKKSQLRGRSRWWKWFVYDLPSYSSPVPVHVISKAVEIKEKLPSARFNVHALEFDRRGYERWKADPFLEVRIFGSDMGFYFEAWEEPTFDGEFTTVKIPKDLPEALQPLDKFPFS